MYSYSRQIRLPELEGIWKWPRMVSPHLPDVEQDSIEWSASFGVFTPEVHALVHERGKLSEYLKEQIISLSLSLSALQAASC